jgi:predicted transcriptional regulator
MIIEIRDDLFYKLVELMKHRNLSIYNELKEIQPLDDKVATDTLAKARELKTQRVKQLIRETIKELLSQDIQPTKYKINKKTGIAFITLNKYYDGILEEIKR